MPVYKFYHTTRNDDSIRPLYISAADMMQAMILMQVHHVNASKKYLEEAKEELKEELKRPDLCDHNVAYYRNLLLRDPDEMAKAFINEYNAVMEIPGTIVKE